jgi:hypothetical protein
VDLSFVGMVFTLFMFLVIIGRWMLAEKELSIADGAMDVAAIEGDTSCLLLHI